MRRYEIDWVRNISILMLFVYHTAAIFCNYGDFYIISEQKNFFADLIILILFTWYMPLLFFLAGGSTYFSSKRRNLKEYIVERINKLFIPLLFGIIVLVPPQTYMARLWRGEGDLNYFEHIKYFFTNITDFTGFDGAFTPAHLWFILYLFVVSIVGGVIIFITFKNDKEDKIISIIKKTFCHKYNIISLLILGIMSDIFPSIMGKSILGCFIIFILGYIVYEDENILNCIIDNRFLYLIGFVFFATVGLLYTLVFRLDDLTVFMWVMDSLLKNGVLICAITTIVGYSSIYLNKNNDLLKYLNKSAFPIYLIHQPILLFLAFIVVPFSTSSTLAMIFIIIVSFAFTFIIFELIKNLKIFNILLGMK